MKNHFPQLSQTVRHLVVVVDMPQRRQEGRVQGRRAVHSGAPQIWAGARQVMGMGGVYSLRSDTREGNAGERSACTRLIRARPYIPFEHAEHHPLSYIRRCVMG